jgi:hypothetical protein
VREGGRKMKNADAKNLCIFSFEEIVIIRTGASEARDNEG